MKQPSKRSRPKARRRPTRRKQRIRKTRRRSTSVRRQQIKQSTSKVIKKVAKTTAAPAAGTLVAVKDGQASQPSTVQTQPIQATKPKVEPSTAAWLWMQVSGLWSSDPAKKNQASGGSVGAMRRAYKDADREVKRLEALLKREESRGGPGRNFKEFTKQLGAAKADRDRATRALSDAEAAAGRGQMYGAIAQVGALVGGSLAGERMAASADKRFGKSIEANKAAVAVLAKDARATMRKLELKKGDATIHRANLRANYKEGRAIMQRGPIGGGKIAALLLAAGATRYTASGVQDPTAKAALNAASVFEGSLAVGILGKSILYRNNPTAAIPAADRATIRAAGLVGKQKDPVKTRRSPAKRKPATTKKVVTPPSTKAAMDQIKAGVKALDATVTKAAKAGMKFLLPAVFVGVGATAMMRGASPASAATQGFDAASSGSATRYSKLRKRGYSKAVSTAGAVDKFVGAPFQGMAVLADKVASRVRWAAVSRPYRPKQSSQRDFNAAIAGFTPEQKQLAKKMRSESRGFINAAAANVTQSRTRSSLSQVSQPVQPASRNKRRGTQNLANLKSILKSRQFGAPKRKKKARKQ